MKSMGHGYVYVSGRTRAKGETNGKSGNLNNVFAQIYPAELDIPGNECLVVFDADQVSLACLSKQRHEPRSDGFLSVRILQGVCRTTQETDRQIHFSTW